MDSETREATIKELLAMLEPCLADPPTAKAVMVVNAPTGVQFCCFNMSSMEVVSTLTGAGIFLEKQLDLGITGMVQ